MSLLNIDIKYIVRYIMNITNIVRKFLHKFFFILKAASDGWRISYIGADQFNFYNNINCEFTTIDGFTSRYSTLL